jgi:hypothetical protein
VSFGSFAFRDFKFSLVILDDELPHSLGSQLLLTRKPLSQFLVAMLDPIAMDEICQSSEIFVAEVEYCDSIEDRESD